MRIALFSETFLPNFDGVVHTLCHLLEHLAEHGHESILFAPEGGPDTYANTRIFSLSGVPFPAYPDLKLVPPIADVRAQLHPFRPDILHVLSPVVLGIIGVRQAKLLGLPLVASYHTDVPGFAVRWGLSWWHGPLVTYLRWIHNRADLTLCPSEATRSMLAQQGYQRLAIWSRGVDSLRFHPRRSCAAMRHRLSGGEPEKPLLLYVGRLSREKRIPWLKRVLDRLPDARLAIVGDGPQGDHLKQLFAGSPTHFAGYMHGNELAATYASADIFVFPGANETFGNVVLEAMASGLPVVAPRSGGVLDHVVDGETGLLFSPESIEDCVHAVQLLWDQPELAVQMGTNGRRAIESRSWSSVMDGLLIHYQRILDSHHLNPALNRRPIHRSISEYVQPGCPGGSKRRKARDF